MSREKFDRIQMEVARRSSLQKKQTKDTTTELGRYSSKYALTEILICGKCGTACRRSVWTKNGKKRYVWRCISRMDYGKKYCSDSPTIDEYLIHQAIVEAIREVVNDDNNLLALKNLQTHIKKYYGSIEDDSIVEDEIRLNTLKDTVVQMAKELDTDSEEFVRVSKEIAEIKNRIALKKQRQIEASANENRMNEVINLTDILKNQPLEYDDKATRKLIDCIKVMSKNELLIIFKGGIKKTIRI